MGLWEALLGISVPPEETPRTRSREILGFEVEPWWQLAFVYGGLGAGVMASYVYGIQECKAAFPNDSPADKLWGRIAEPEQAGLKQLYQLGMAGAVVGYFMNLYLVNQIYDRMPRDVVDRLTCAMAAFMISEWYWLPATVVYLQTGCAGLFDSIRAQLFFSGCCAVYMAYMFVYEIPQHVEKSRKVDPQALLIGQIGMCLFAAHCFCLDGCLWSFYNEMTPGEVAAAQGPAEGSAPATLDQLVKMYHL